MLRRHLWKLTLSAALVLWSVFTLMPLKDQPFGDYVKQEASAKPAEFAKLLTEVDTRIKTGRAPSVYVALKQVGLEQKLDLSQFFPDIKLEKTLTNVEKRNNILLNELLRLSKARLQLGLDLAGGVAAGNASGAGRAWIAPQRQRQVTVVQRHGVDLDQHFAALGDGHGLFVKPQAVQTGHVIIAVGAHGETRRLKAAPGSGSGDPYCA